MAVESKKKLKCDFILQLVQREYGTPCNYRHNVRIIQELVLQNRQFKSVFTINSNQAIHYECQKIYLENYRICSAVKAFNHLPTQLYKLMQHSQSKQRIVDGLICPSHYSLENICSDNLGNFLGLTVDGWLYSYSSLSGKFNQRIYLSNIFSFKNIMWNTNQHSLVIKSTLNSIKLENRLNSVTNSDICSVRNKDSVCALVVFTVCPLQFHSAIVIKKKAFGKDVVGVTLSENVLFISHRNGVINLYSYLQLQKEFQTFSTKIGERNPSGGVTGINPDGVPFNIVVTEQPAVLRMFKSAQNDLQLGGVPWVFIRRPNSSMFKVHSLWNEKLLENGDITSGVVSIEEEVVMMHPDESGRIIHYTASALRVLHQINDGTKLSEQFLFRTSVPQKPSEHKKEIITSSGRIVKQKLNTNITNEAFQHQLLVVDFEDELDVLVMLVANESHYYRRPITGYVVFCSNQTGTILKRIDLVESWHEEAEHNIHLDIDVLVHIVKLSGHSACYIYSLYERLDCMEGPSLQEQASCKRYRNSTN